MNQKQSFIVLIVFSLLLGFTSCGGEDEVAVLAVRLDKKSLTLFKGESAKLTATVAPADASIKTVTWKSSDPMIASVDANGNVSALAAGSVSVTATSADEIYAASCSVVVLVAVQGITLDKQELTLVEGQTALLNATIIPSDATTKDVTWTSNNSRIVKVDNGNIIAVGVGTAIITVSTVDGNKTASCTVTVDKTQNIDYKPYGDGNQW